MSVDNLKRPVTKKDIISAVVVIILMGVPYAIREIFPDHIIVKNLFGGFKLLVYWGILFYLFWRYDKWQTKKFKEKEEKLTK